MRGHRSWKTVVKIEIVSRPLFPSWTTSPTTLRRLLVPDFERRYVRPVVLIRRYPISDLRFCQYRADGRGDAVKFHGFDVSLALI